MPYAFLNVESGDDPGNRTATSPWVSFSEH